MTLPDFNWHKELFAQCTLTFESHPSDNMTYEV